MAKGLAFWDLRAIVLNYLKPSDNFDNIKLICKCLPFQDGDVLLTTSSCRVRRRRLVIVRIR